MDNRKVTCPAGRDTLPGTKDLVRDTCDEPSVPCWHLLSGQLKKIADSAFLEDAEALVVNGRYLREKFRVTGFLPAKAG